MNPTFWTKERVEILKRRWAANWTARAIGELLGCTRNAVLGKAQRLGLPESINRGGAPLTTGADVVRRARAPLPPRPVEPPAGADEPQSRRIAFADLKAGECRWMSGHDGRCCGHATVRMPAGSRDIASPYCGFHSARAYRPAQAKSA